MRSLGIDIGATSIKGGIIEDGEMICYRKEPTNARDGVEAILSSLYKVIDALIDKADEDSAIGISSTGDINPISGEVIYATNSMPSFAGLNLAEIVSRHTGRRATVINDCIAALIGEWKYGAAAGCQNVIMLTLGTGVGGAVMTNGTFLLGENFRACRLGHTSLYQNGRKCPCGRRGCAEAYVSATGLLETARDMGKPFSDCNQIFSCGDEAFIHRVVNSFTDDLAQMISNLTAIFDAEKIIIGGGLVLLSSYWMDPLMKKVSSIARVEKAELGNNSGIIGAACIAKDKLFINEVCHAKI